MLEWNSSHAAPRPQVLQWFCGYLQWAAVAIQRELFKNVPSPLSLIFPLLDFPLNQPTHLSVPFHFSTSSFVSFCSLLAFSVFFPQKIQMQNEPNKPIMVCRWEPESWTRHLITQREKARLYLYPTLWTSLWGTRDSILLWVKKTTPSLSRMRVTKRTAVHNIFDSACLKGYIPFSVKKLGHSITANECSKEAVGLDVLQRVCLSLKFCFLSITVRDNMDKNHRFHGIHHQNWCSEAGVGVWGGGQQSGMCLLCASQSAELHLLVRER